MKMKRSKRKFTKAFKIKVAVEALKERETLSELASRFDLHSNQIRQWKGEFLEDAENVFAGKSTKVKDPGQEMAQQYNKELDESIAQIEQGKLYTHEEMDERIKEWSKQESVLDA